jgi:hypothetical protein
VSVDRGTRTLIGCDGADGSLIGRSNPSTNDDDRNERGGHRGSHDETALPAFDGNSPNDPITRAGGCWSRLRESSHRSAKLVVIHPNHGPS